MHRENLKKNFSTDSNVKSLKPINNAEYSQFPQKHYLSSNLIKGFPLTKEWIINDFQLGITKDTGD